MEDEMGEYALHHGERVKIGTCENMYYLRADQAGLVQAQSGNVDPMSDGLAGAIRFRFPFPDEDGVEPGSFDQFDRGVHVPGVTVPEGVEHYSVQFVAERGYVTSLPCPEALEPTTHGLKVHRNGWQGAVQVVQQKWFDGRLVTVCRCGGCHALYRVETLDTAQPLIDACRAEAKSRDWQDTRDINKTSSAGDWWREVARRIEAGYTA
jgi:hypothetical protein